MDSQVGGEKREEENSRKRQKNKALLFLLSSSFWLGLLGLDWLCVFGLSSLFLSSQCVVVCEWKREKEKREGKGKGEKRAWL